MLTGKGLSFGGSLAHTEATGYGLVYFVDEYLKCHNDSFEGKTVVVHGSGNVAIYAVQKATQLGGKVIAASDTKGSGSRIQGIDYKVLEDIYNKKRSGNDRGVSLALYVDARPNAVWHAEDGPVSGSFPAISHCPARVRTPFCRGRPSARGERLQGGGRGREHAHDHRSHQLPHRERRRVHAR